jgi:hypothetical protein
MGMQLDIFEQKDTSTRSREEILSAVKKLRDYHAQGILGGEKMPEDSNPGLDKSSKDNFHYFTLPMALNYQRNSYKLWEAAVAAYEDPETNFIFSPEKVVSTSEEALRSALMKHKVALQPNRHPSIWRTICGTLTEHYQGDVRNLLTHNSYDISLVLNDVQIKHKKGFPYLSGHKIANYWLYVISQYTDAKLKNKICLSIAPDTHIIQASVMLGVIESGNDQNAVRTDVAKAWEKILVGTDLCPIDVHTPLWLWSRRHFEPSVWD